MLLVEAVDLVPEPEVLREHAVDMIMQCFDAVVVDVFGAVLHLLHAGCKVF